MFFLNAYKNKVICAPLNVCAILITLLCITYWQRTFMISCPLSPLSLSLFHVPSSCLMKDACCEGVCLAARQLDVVFNGLLWDKSRSAAHLMHSVSIAPLTSSACLFQGWGHERLRSSWGHAVVFFLSAIFVVHSTQHWMCSETFHMFTCTQPQI